MVRHVCDNDPRVIVSISMVGIKMVYKSYCCKTYFVGFVM